MDGSVTEIAFQTVFSTAGYFIRLAESYGAKGILVAKAEDLKAAFDEQTMRILARNMAFLFKNIALGKEAYALPEQETKVPTNFIR